MADNKVEKPCFKMAIDSLRSVLMADSIFIFRSGATCRILFLLLLLLMVLFLFPHKKCSPIAFSALFHCSLYREHIILRKTASFYFVLITRVDIHNIPLHMFQHQGFRRLGIMLFDGV